MPDALDLIKAAMLARGWTIVVDLDGTERVYRPDGTLAITAVLGTLTLSTHGTTTMPNVARITKES